MYFVVVPEQLQFGTVEEDVLNRALCILAVDTGRVGWKAYPVRVGGNGGVVSTAKAGQMDPVFTWQGTLPLSVNEGGRDSKEGVRWEGGYCPLCIGCMNVGTKYDAHRHRRKSVV